MRRVLRRVPVAMLLLGQLPWLARLAIGCVLAWLAASVLTWLFAGPAFGSDRFPIVIATSVAIVLIALVMEVDAATDDLLRERDERAATRATAIVAAIVPALLVVVVPAVAAAQGGPCPVGETCLPPSAASAAAALGVAAMLSLTMGAGGRFVSMRRDAAVRRPAGSSPRPLGVSALLERARATAIDAWRAG